MMLRNLLRRELLCGMFGNEKLRIPMWSRFDLRHHSCLYLEIGTAQ